MLKYRGTYRVLYECDVRTGKPTEFTYIPCIIKKGTNICRHSTTMLNAYIPSMKIILSLLREYPDIFALYQDGHSEGTIIFNELNITKVAEILKAKVMGKNMSAKPKKKMNISEEQRNKLRDNMAMVRKYRSSPIRNEEFRG
jgi:hypothetical protein